MKIQNFIFTWNQFTSNAIDIESKISNYGKTIVVNSNVNDKKDGWINLNDAYFAEQWNTLVSNTDTDTDFIFNILADVSVVDFDNLFNRFKSVSSKYEVGIYAPYADYSYHQYDLNQLYKVQDNLYEVPNTDCLCWFINKSILKNNLIFDVNTNMYGYGADWYYSAECLLQNKRVLRDYSIRVTHPPYKNYDGDKANTCFNIWFNEQTSIMKKTMSELMTKHSNYLIG